MPVAERVSIRARLPEWSADLSNPTNRSTKSTGLRQARKAPGPDEREGIAAREVDALGILAFLFRVGRRLLVQELSRDARARSVVARVPIRVQEQVHVGIRRDCRVESRVPAGGVIVEAQAHRVVVASARAEALGVVRIRADPGRDL